MMCESKYESGAGFLIHDFQWVILSNFGTGNPSPTSETPRYSHIIKTLRNAP